MTDSKIAISTPSLPKGGGAIRGIGETFQPNAFTGTAGLSIPIHTSPCRGFEPHLSLDYSSGSGNGIFGIGFSLATPNISRKTEKGFPKYDDTDTFLISNADDLVPKLVKKNGEWVREEHSDKENNYSITQYRPRTEGLFARIEKWVNSADGSIHWRVTTKDNVTSIYGKDPNCRIADPDDKKNTRVFQWLIERTYDPKGNQIVYEYHPDGANKHIRRMKYGNYLPYHPKTKPRRDAWHFELIFDYRKLPPDPSNQAAGPESDEPWKPGQLPNPDELIYEKAIGKWGPVKDQRADPHSSYRSGFEIRTQRLCRRILLFHRFGKDTPFLVHGSHLDHEETPCLSFLRRVTQVGYRKDKDGKIQQKAMPPLDLEYSKPKEGAVFKPLARGSANGGNGDLHQRIDKLVDLYGDGLPGILHSDDRTTLFSRPRGGGHYNAPKEPAHFPIDRNLESGQFALMDLGGDGKLDLVAQTSFSSGYFQSNPVEETWEPYRSFQSTPTELHHPQRQMADVTGDGLADLVMFESEGVQVYRSRGKEGFAPATITHCKSEIALPRPGSPVEYVGFADMFGDGGNHWVRIRSGSVECWPHLGYGRFGEKVFLENAPDFGGQLDPSRLFLTDIDGSGTTDLVYARHDHLEIYRNQSGTGFAKMEPLPLPQSYDNLDHIRFADVLGNGTACLILTSRNPDLSLRHEYFDFNADGKPHLLTGINNNMGAEKKIHYVASTEYYLDDLEAGKPWVTRLSFPVQVIKSVEVIDHIAGSRLVTRYAYHDGYYDAEEREFRGFGYVEQWDTESFDDHRKWIADRKENGASDFSLRVDEDPTSYVAPVYTRSWFHTGASVKAGQLSNHYQGHYYDEDPDSGHLPDSALDEATFDPQPETIGEAYRALHGHKLREEIYGLDHQQSPDLVKHPYAVTESNFKIRLLQPKGDQKHAVCFVHPSEEISWHYERNPQDPRVSHSLTLEVDKFGNVLREAAIGYGRRAPVSDPALTDLDKARQSQLLITYTENVFTNAVLTGGYHAPLPAESRTFELAGFKPEKNAKRFSVDELTRNSFELLSSATEIPYEQKADNTTAQKRLIEHVWTTYRKNDLSGLLPFGVVESLALPGESYKLAFTPGLLAEVFKRKKADQSDAVEDLLPDRGSLLEGKGGAQGGYIAKGGNWWIPSGRVFFSPNSDDDAETELEYAKRHFFLAHRTRDPFHTDAVSTESFVTYDAYDLLVLESRDPLGNVVRSDNDYCTLQPALITDPNGNRTAVSFDPLGMVVATAVMGKKGKTLGDLLKDFDTDPPLKILQAFTSDPHAKAASLLGKATTRIVYDLDRYQRAGLPPFAATLARETHFNDPGGAQTKIQVSFSYSDGFGREIQKKIQAEAGDAPQRHEPVPLPISDIRPGDLVQDKQNKLVQANAPRRWVGTGRTVFNNKGKPVKRYEPFFSSTHLYEAEREMTDTGVSSILFYDPVGRVVATLHPNHTWEKVVFTPWRQETWDVNDTVQLDPRTDPDVSSYVTPYFASQPTAWKTWLHERLTDPENPPADSHGRFPEKDAAVRTLPHANTPTVTCFDALGRPFLTIADNGKDAKRVDRRYAMRVILDIEGNHRALIDEKGRVAMRYDYDMLGNRIHKASMDAGERWMLYDVEGKPLYAWDTRGHTFRTEYDPLRRRRHSFVTGADPANPKRELLTERLVYGEQHPEAEQRNLRGELYLHIDQAGAVASEEHDFKGNLLRGSRRIAKEYKQTLDWSAVDKGIQIKATVPLDPAALEAALTVVVETEIFASSTQYDALNRPVQTIAPHSDQPKAKVNVIQHGYDPANLLKRVDVWLDHRPEPGGLLDAEQVPPAPRVGVKNIDYNAKGQRIGLDYKNGASTSYDYDPLTFRLTHLYTRRGAAFTDDCDNPQPPPPTIAAPDSPPQGKSCGLQNLHYTYDPVGNITQIRDQAQRMIYFKYVSIDPTIDYTYDALYRLIEATGREQLQWMTRAQFPHSYTDYWRVVFVAAKGAEGFDPRYRDRMGRYCEKYVYDPGGNLVKMSHHRSCPDTSSWTRTFAYNDASLIENGKHGTELKTGNRLSSSVVRTRGFTNTERYGYDAHGNVTLMHLRGKPPGPNIMHWDYRDQLSQADLGGGGTVYYVYDSAGQRVRKVWEKSGNLIEGRIYLGGFEIFRRRQGKEWSVQLEREMLHIMDDEQRVALVETRTVGTEDGQKELTRYQLGNHLGSASLELNDQANIISYEEYTPYGSTSYQQVRNRTGTPKRYRYFGKERDDSNGLYYYGARYYAPWLGRWLSPDPAGAIDGLNLYRFVRGNPIRTVDHWGLAGDDDLPFDHNQSQYVSHRRALKAATPTKPYSQESLRTAVHAKGSNLAHQFSGALESRGASNLADVVEGVRLLHDYSQRTGIGRGRMPFNIIEVAERTHDENSKAQAALSAADQLADETKQRLGGKGRRGAIVAQLPQVINETEGHARLALVKSIEQAEVKKLPIVGTIFKGHQLSSMAYKLATGAKDKWDVVSGMKKNQQRDFEKSENQVAIARSLAANPPEIIDTNAAASAVPAQQERTNKARFSQKNMGKK